MLQYFKIYHTQIQTFLSLYTLKKVKRRKMMKLNGQMSESYLIGSLLTAVGGYLDAYTYLARGSVFANAQTGNIVLFGINMAEQNYKKALFYLVSIITFGFGIAISEIIRDRFKEHNDYIHWRQIIVLIETAVVLSVAFIKSDIVSNTLVSFVCALQVQTFKKMNGHRLATTMCTGNLRTATESLFKAVKTKDKFHVQKSIQFFEVILIFILGAVLGAVITGIYGVKSVLFAAVPLIVCFVIMFIDTEKEEKNEDC